MTVSPTDHQLLFAAGAAGVLRSDDGGERWLPVSAPDGDWLLLEVSPVNPTVIYGVVVTSPPAEYGTNHWHEFRVSRDAGMNWETVRVDRERIVPGTQPCAYEVRSLQPLSVSAARVLTVEGCTGHGDAPRPHMSVDEGRSTTPFPSSSAENGPANAVVGGGGANPNRWYVAQYYAGMAYTRIRHSRVLRSDDGETWTTIFEDDGGQPDRGTGRPMDFVSLLAYDPRRPDDVFAQVTRYEPDPEPYKLHHATGSIVRMSRDAGTTWVELGGSQLPSVSQLAVGVDGRHLFAATSNGVYRLLLPQ
ncbi:MAG: hypothetical protein U0893_27670 [Chloroflexota bacterium]